MSEIENGIGITHRVVLPNGSDMTFQVAVNSTTKKEAIFGLLDTVTGLAQREFWKAELPKKEELVKKQAEQRVVLEARIRELATRRTQMLAAFNAQFEISGKRVNKPSSKHQIDLTNIEGDLEAARGSLENWKRDFPIAEWTAARLKALIAGEPEPEKPQHIEDAQVSAVLAMLDAAD